MSDSSSAAPSRAGAHARHRRSLTEGPITPALLMFSLPVLGGNVLQTLNGTVNQFFVSHTPGLGVTAITALGNSNTLMFLLMGAVFGISMACNILIAQAVGGGDLPMAKRVMGTATTFFIAYFLGDMLRVGASTATFAALAQARLKLYVALEAFAATLMGTLVVLLGSSGLVDAPAVAYPVCYGLILIAALLFTLRRRKRPV